MRDCTLSGDEHILSIFSYELSFFQKLVLCRGLKFAIPQRVSPVEIKASFEKAYWNLERHLPNENLWELEAATLRSVALEYIDRSSPKPPKALLQAVEDLKKRDDIVVTKPDKRSGVVVIVHCIVTSHLASIYERQSKYEESKDLYMKSLSIAIETGDKKEEATCYGNLGIVYRSRGEYGKAEERQRKALTISKEIGDKQGEAIR